MGKRESGGPMVNKANVSSNGADVSFDGMNWPGIGKRLGDAEWALRYGEPTQMDLLLAASVLSAYRQMVLDPESKRRRVIRQLRLALDTCLGCGRIPGNGYQIYTCEREECGRTVCSDCSENVGSKLLCLTCARAPRSPGTAHG